MLDEKTIKTVKETAPVLKEHSNEIGKRFYQLLFKKVPDLYNLFNQTNQKRGIQQEALAYSVYAAGENIDHLEAVEPVIRRVTEKHVAIGVEAEQYPVVGETLLEAVKDVLGETASDDILTLGGKRINISPMNLSGLRMNDMKSWRTCRVAGKDFGILSSTRKKKKVT